MARTRAGVSLGPFGEERLAVVAERKSLGAATNIDVAKNCLDGRVPLAPVALPKRWRKALVHAFDATFCETNSVGESQYCRKVCDSTGRRDGPGLSARAANRARRRKTGWFEGHGLPPLGGRRPCRPGVLGAIIRILTLQPRERRTSHILGIGGTHILKINGSVSKFMASRTYCFD
jgi:hypothetical protein